MIEALEARTLFSVPAGQPVLRGDVLVIRGYDRRANTITVSLSPDGQDLIAVDTFTPAPTVKAPAPEAVSRSVTLALAVVKRIKITCGRHGDTVMIRTASAPVSLPAVVRGGAGNDTIFGGNGRETLIGGAGNDYLDAGAGRNRMVGGPGADILFGGTAADKIAGGAGNDAIDDAGGGGTVTGGSGNDQIKLSPGDSLHNVHPGSGDDAVFVTPGPDFPIRRPRT